MDWTVPQWGSSWTWWDSKAGATKTARRPAVSPGRQIMVDGLLVAGGALLVYVGLAVAVGLVAGAMFELGRGEE